MDAKYRDRNIQTRVQLPTQHNCAVIVDIRVRGLKGVVQF